MARIKIEVDAKMAAAKSSRLAVQGVGVVSTILRRPANARWLLVLAHGAGAGMSHPFMEALSEALARVAVATLRYQFPYMEQGRGMPDPPNILTATVAAAVEAGAKAAPGLPLLAGGKSLGGRMTSTAAAEGKLNGVSGLVFFGFPLHPPKRPGTKRAEHLKKVTPPMLFLQGTRDDLADMKLLRPICKDLGERATLQIIDGADHSFHVLKKSGRTDEGVLREIAENVAAWAERETITPL